MSDGRWLVARLILTGRMAEKLGGRGVASLEFFAADSAIPDGGTV